MSEKYTQENYSKCKTWREKAAFRIGYIIENSDNAALAKTGDVDAIKRLKGEISSGYPWNPRSGHPYKIWLSETKNQIKLLQEKYKAVSFWEK